MAAMLIIAAIEFFYQVFSMVVKKRSLCRGAE
jgi:hypothetical protein